MPRQRGVGATVPLPVLVKAGEVGTKCEVWVRVAGEGDTSVAAWMAIGNRVVTLQFPSKTQTCGAGTRGREGVTMAETKKTKAAKAKPGKAALAAKKPKAKGAGGNAKSARGKSATINIADLIDHPLVADLLTVGAMAAVGAIANHKVQARTGEGETGSSRAIKAAGKAAAAAVGKRLMTEVDAIKNASNPKAPKRGSK